MLTTLAVLSQALRTALLAGGFVMIVLAAVDWAVRTRRLNPFSGVSRFMRARVEPRLAGVERLVVRGGGHPSTTGWWAVFAYIVLALLVLAAADLVLETVAEASSALGAGPLGIVVLLVQWTFGFLILALMVRVISSWIPPLARSRWTAWSIGATDWFLRPLRQVLPPLGPVDISPLVAYFALKIVRYLILAVLLRGVR